MTDFDDTCIADLRDITFCFDKEIKVTVDSYT